MRSLRELSVQNLNLPQKESQKGAEVGGSPRVVISGHSQLIKEKGAELGGSPRVVISGHSHKPSVTVDDGVLFVNPGLLHTLSLPPALSLAVCVCVCARARVCVCVCVCVCV